MGRREEMMIRKMLSLIDETDSSLKRSYFYKTKSFLKKFLSSSSALSRLAAIIIIPCSALALLSIAQTKAPTTQFTENQAAAGRGGEQANTQLVGLLDRGLKTAGIDAAPQVEEDAKDLDVNFNDEAPKLSWADASDKELFLEAPVLTPQNLRRYSFISSLAGTVILLFSENAGETGARDLRKGGYALIASSIASMSWAALEDNRFIPDNLSDPRMGLAVAEDGTPMATWSMAF